MVDLAHIPFLGGAVMLQNSEDPRKNIMYAIVGMIIIVLLFESFGFQLGTLGQMVVGIFPALIGYVFGRVEGEAKKPSE